MRIMKCNYCDFIVEIIMSEQTETRGYVVDYKSEMIRHMLLCHTDPGSVIETLLTAHSKIGHTNTGGDNR